MKPDWKDAPEWANWLAQDRDGTWVWFKKRPFERVGHNAGWYTDDGYELAADPSDFRTSLEKRP